MAADEAGAGGARRAAPLVIGGRFRYLDNLRMDRAVSPRHPTLAEIDGALSEIGRWPGYRATPLWDLRGLAGSAGIERLWYKDEGERFGLGSFKPMGGAYAVGCLLARVAAERAGRTVTPADLARGHYRDIVSDVTLTCATDGNHGRAVAWGARTFGGRAVVYLASHVSAGRERAIAGYGADVVRTSGNHDEAVRTSAAAARRNGWYVISETTSASDPRIAADILTGYGALIRETLTQLNGSRPTHVFVQAGVGGLAAAVCACTRQLWADAAPSVVVVEAENADCIYRSLAAGERVAVEGTLETVMAGLAAGEASAYAWEHLSTGAAAAVAMPDEPAIATLRMLAAGTMGDEPFEAGESGVAGLAAALLASRDADARTALGIDQDSRMLTIGTEGVTDREAWARLRGVS